MLVEIKLRHFAIIDELSLQLRAGLNLLSGETGAGKSVILKSLGLLMGEKAHGDCIQSGFEFAHVEGVFDLSHRPDVQRRLVSMGVQLCDDTLIVRRVISSGGRSRIYLNGFLSSLNDLRDVVAPMVELTGYHAPLVELTAQHESRHLLSRAYHLDLLDHYSNCWKMRTDFEQQFRQRQEIKKKIDELNEGERHCAQRLDYLQFQRDEIKALNLSAGQDVHLEEQYTELKKISRVKNFVSRTCDFLNGRDDSIVHLLYRLEQELKEPTLHKDLTLIEKMAGVTTARTLLEEIGHDLLRYQESMELDLNSLESVELRMNQLRTLQRKYGKSVDEILSSLQAMQDEIQQLETRDQTLQHLSGIYTQLESDLTSLSRHLFDARKQGAQRLASSVNTELAELGFKDIKFEIRIEPSAILGVAPFEVEFMLRHGSGEELRPLAKIASGGELSRIMLALKKVANHSELPRTFVFDEVDGGISGQTAQKVGKKLKAIAQGQQVICVTHLPQVAAYADCHFLIAKVRKKNASAATIRVTELAVQQKVHEIARLISGKNVTDISLAHAKQLLREAHQA